MYTIDKLLEKYEELDNDNAFRTWLQKELDAGNITMPEILNFMTELYEQIEKLIPEIFGEQNGENQE